MTTTSGQDVVAGFFDDRGKAEKAVRALRGAGFAQIGVASSDTKQARKLAEKQDVQMGVAATPGEQGRLDETMGEPDYSDPGDFRGTLLAAHLPDQQADLFERRMREHKGMLVTVQVPLDRRAEALRCLAEAGGDTGAGAAEVGSAQREAESLPPVAAPAEAAGVAPKPTPTTREQADRDMGMRQILLHGELLKVHRDRIQRGEVRLRKEVVTEPRTVEVPVSREELVMERTPADARTEADARPVAGGEEVRIPLSEEHARVEKQPVVTEKVNVGKRVVEGAERLKEEVKREELRVEEEGKLSPEERERIRRDRAA